jgi:ABC-type Fe3+ transport system permease subunit
VTTTTTAKEARTPARRRPAAPGRAASNKRLDPVSRGILAAILIIITLLVLVPLWSILREAFSESGWRVIGRITEPTNLRIIGNAGRGSCTCWRFFPWSRRRSRWPARRSRSSGAAA